MHDRLVPRVRLLTAPVPAAALLSLLAATAPAQFAHPGELAACRRWADRAFGRDPDALPAHLELIAEDVAEGVTRGRSWRGTPYHMGGRDYAHGVAYNASKHLRVVLDRPGARFLADFGLEDNDDTRRGATLGQGSVRARVTVAEQERFASPVLRLADGPRHVDVPLAGALSFDLLVDDGGDGRGWDQALWGEATVELQDGGSVRLQDLPWGEPGQRAGGPSLQHGGAAWAPSREARSVRDERLDAARTRRTVIDSDPRTGLEVRTEAVLHDDFPAVEWVVHLTNRGTVDTPVLEGIRAQEGVLPVPAGPVTVHGARGGVASFDDFAPTSTALPANAHHHWQPGGGRSSNQVMPFFNVEGTGGGAIVAIGWTGEWATDFSASKRGTPMVAIGQAQTHLVLHPGETIRTPRVLVMAYEGDRWRGQNLLRRFVLAHHRPQRNGAPQGPVITCGNWGGTSAAVHLENIRTIAARDLPLDYYWIDAEWYGRGGWPVNVGNWSVKQDLYPQGFAPLSKALGETGRRLMLWFEPERVFRGTAWQTDPQIGKWLLGNGSDNFLFDLGNPEARAFLTDFVSGRIREFGLGCYRQDFNFDPLGYWQAADAPDRQGLHEIRYVEGLYAFWDALLERHPGLLIDNCASGGRRIDLETIGRATPFWRTDGPRDAIAHQCHTQGLLPWVPLSATSQDRARDDYEFRSSQCSGLCLNWWVAGDVPAERIPDDFPFDWAKRTLQQYRQVGEYYLGDYYPLTSYSQAADVWMVYQLDRPEHGDGLVVALRRPGCPYEVARWPLRALDPEARYRVTDLDGGVPTEVQGRELIGSGLRIELPKRPGSALVRYERVAAGERQGGAR